MTERMFAPRSEVRFTGGEDGGVLLDVGTGKYYSLNIVGSAVWSGLRQGHTIEEIAGNLMTRFNLPSEKIRTDVVVFVERLLELRLINAV